MKALVIGASGFIGGAIVRALERDGVQVAGTGCSRAGTGLLPLDLRDARAVSACVGSVRPEVVFVAVRTPGERTRGGDTILEEAEALYGDGIAHAARTASRYGATLVYYSTERVFEGAKELCSEEAPPAPVSRYGQLRWEAEQAVRTLASRHLIVRTSVAFGWDRASENVAMTVWRALQAGRRLSPAGSQWCHPTLVDYLAEAGVRLVRMGVEGTVHVIGKERLSEAALMRALASAMALDAARITVVPDAQGAPRAAGSGGVLKSEKLTRLLGTEPLDLNESLKRFRRHWRADTHVTFAQRSHPSTQDPLKQEILESVRRYYQRVHAPKPFVPYQTHIQYAGRVFGEEELVNLTDSALDFWLTLGPYGDVFEQNMRRFFGARDVVMVNSGSTANLTVILALMSKQLERSLQAGDEVITPAVTFPTTLAPLVHSGLIPVFVDCEVGTYNINPHRIEDAISDKTRAIMIPHTLGNPCDLDIIGEIAGRHHLYLVEDCCDALGATFRGQLVGTFGELGTLSFFPAHQITTGEGGAVVVNAPRLSRIVRSVRDWGRDCWCAPGESNTCGKRFGWELGDLPRGYDHKYIYSNLGYNFKPTDLQAAIGVAQLDRLPAFVEARRRNFRRLYEGLASYEDALILPRLDPRANPSWFGFPITVRPGVSRDALVQWLESAKIETRVVFGGNILRQPGYRHIACRIHGELAQSDTIMRNAFFIGVYPGLTDEMLGFILERFRAFFAQHASAQVVGLHTAT